jgi:DNA-binding transcriptional ArsR family regulator
MTDRPTTTLLHRALADDRRARIVAELESAGEGLDASDLGRRVGLHPNTVRWHLGVLADAGLVDSRRAGRETRYTPTPAPMGEAISWMTEVGGRWDERLAALERQVARRRARP